MQCWLGLFLSLLWHGCLIQGFRGIISSGYEFHHLSEPIVVSRSLFYLFWGGVLGIGLTAGLTYSVLGTQKSFAWYLQLLVCMFSMALSWVWLYAWLVFNALV